MTVGRHLCVTCGHWSSIICWYVYLEEVLVNWEKKEMGPREVGSGRSPNTATCTISTAFLVTSRLILGSAFDGKFPLANASASASASVSATGSSVGSCHIFGDRWQVSSQLWRNRSIWSFSKLRFLIHRPSFLLL